MELYLTFNKLVELPDRILEQTKEYGDIIDYLSPMEMSHYDYKDALDTITYLVSKFKDAKFKYNFPVENSIKINASIGININRKNLSDKVGDIVASRIDNQLWVKQLYCALLEAAPKLNRKEAIYFVNSFFKNISEENIAEILNMSRLTLRNKVKKSCIIKLWIELEPLFKLED